MRAGFLAGRATGSAHRARQWCARPVRQSSLSPVRGGPDRTGSARGSTPRWQSCPAPHSLPGHPHHPAERGDQHPGPRIGVRVQPLTPRDQPRDLLLQPGSAADARRAARASTRSSGTSACTARPGSIASIALADRRPRPPSRRCAGAPAAPPPRAGRAARRGSGPRPFPGRRRRRPPCWRSSGRTCAGRPRPPRRSRRPSSPRSPASVNSSSAARISASRVRCFLRSRRPPWVPSCGVGVAILSRPLRWSFSLLRLTCERADSYRRMNCFVNCQWLTLASCV